MNTYEVAIAIRNRKSGFKYASRCWQGTLVEHMQALMGTYAPEFIQGMRDYIDATPEARAAALSTM